MYKQNMNSMLLDLCLAAYLAKRPDRQVRMLAKQFKKQTEVPVDKATLKLVISSAKPAEVVKKAYFDLTQNPSENKSFDES